jgi:hypothetical protein
LSNSLEEKLRQARVYAAQVRARKSMGSAWLLSPKKQARKAYG